MFGMAQSYEHDMFVNYCSSGKLERVKRGVINGIDPSKDNNIALRNAIANNETAVIQFLLSNEKVRKALGRNPDTLFKMLHLCITNEVDIPLYYTEDSIKEMNTDEKVLKMYRFLKSKEINNFKNLSDEDKVAFKLMFE